MNQTNKKLCPKCFAITFPWDKDCTCNAGFKELYTKDNMLDIIVIAFGVGLTLIALSIAAHIVSCLCPVGNEICIQGCHTRFIVINIICAIGVSFTVIATILMYIAKNKRIPPRR